MVERKVAAIPSALIPSGLAQKEFGLLLTNERFVFVLEKAVNYNPAVMIGTMIGGMAGGMIGAAVAASKASRTQVDYNSADPVALAADPRNVVVPFDSARSVRFRKSMRVHLLEIEYTTPEGRRRKLQAWITPSLDMLKYWKANGVDWRDATPEYVRHAYDALQLALPPRLALGPFQP